MKTAITDFFQRVKNFQPFPTVTSFQNEDGLITDLVYTHLSEMHCLSQDGNVYSYDSSIPGWPIRNDEPVDIQKANEIKIAIRKWLLNTGNRIPDGFMCLLDAQKEPKPALT